MVRATLVNYFDVWGNEEDGYEVNNLCKEGVLEFDVKEASDVNDEMILAELIDFGFIREGVTIDMIEFDDLWPFIEFSDNSNGCPIGRLEFDE